MPLSVSSLTGLKSNRVRHIMEQRVRLFYELHQNKWFHKMNHSLEIIKILDRKQKVMIRKYGSCFF